MIEYIIFWVMMLFVGWFIGNLFGWFVFGRPHGVPFKYFWSPTRGFREKNEKLRKELNLDS